MPTPSRPAWDRFPRQHTRLQRQVARLRLLLGLGLLVGSALLGWLGWAWWVGWLVWHG